MLLMTDDYLIQKLIELCKRFDQDPLEGRHEVARASDLSEQYLYQIISGKPMANGEPRSVGKIARKKLTKAFPDWLDRPSDDSTGAVPADIADFIAKVKAESVQRELPEHIQQSILTLIASSPKKKD